MGTKTKISLVIPVFNEEEVIPELLRRIEAVARVNRERFDLEVIMVDDGSIDESVDVILKAQSELEIEIIQLSRNFGHQAAVMAGIAKANGDAVVIMDADLQDPPELILELVKIWEQGFHVVYGKRISRTGESYFKKISASVFYNFLRWLTDVEIPLDTGDFRLVDRKVVNSLTSMNEKSLFIRGLIAWMGFKQYPMEYHREARYAGETKYPLKKMVALAADAILAFSEKPLRLISKIGLSIFLVAVSTSVFVLLAPLYTTGYQAPGWLSLMLVLLTFGGFQVLCLGVIGSYVLRIYRQTKTAQFTLLWMSSKKLDEPFESVCSPIFTVRDSINQTLDFVFEQRHRNISLICVSRKRSCRNSLRWSSPRTLGLMRRSRYQ